MQQSLSEIVHTTPQRLRLFALMQCLFFLSLSVVCNNSENNWNLWGPVLIFSVSICAVGVWNPKWIQAVYAAWMLIVFPVGWVVSHLLMALVFYGIMTPIGLWRRRSAGDPLGRKFDPEASSYWSARSVRSTSESYFRQF